MNNQYHHLFVDGYKDRWYISWPDGSKFDGQIYKRAQDAKRSLTMLRKSCDELSAN